MGGSLKIKFNPRLYLVTGRELAGDRPLEAVVAAAVRGGVTAVQLREKSASTREFIQLARCLKIQLQAAQIPLLINDRVDVALAVGADGVHVGQSDMTPRDARRLMGPDAIIGLSIEVPAPLESVLVADADYLGVGPICSTLTKSDAAAPWGLEQLAAFTKHCSTSIVAIGGIHSGNAAQAIQAGADGIAVVSAICAAADPEAAARELRTIIDRAILACHC